MNHVSFRNAWTEISLDAIQQNIRAFKNHINIDTKMMAVVKADGYGHGAVEVAKTAISAGADYIAVAILDEAVILRDAGIEHPLLVLGYTPPDFVSEAIKRDIALTVFTKEVADRIGKEAKKQHKTAKVHVKIDSGMNRIGVQTKEEALNLVQSLQSNFVFVEGIFTHFADADNPADTSYTELQFDHFMDVVEYLEGNDAGIPIRHCCNSAATIAFPKLHLDMVRVGISIYGLYPSEHLRKIIPLKQAMTFKTKPVFVKKVKAGDAISYGCTYIPKRDSFIATIPIGYGDGFSRSLSNKGNVTVHGMKAPIVGRVCMDQSMIDVTDIGVFEMDDEVVIFGDRADGYIPMGEVAELMNTIHYETACLIGKRIPRIYIKDGEVVKELGQVDNSKMAVSI
ncbi:alanine racemase [Oceanobacillus piezotolerans]|uniref:Alanine racemase n=1 Tax=Oceanobacillus piezotolerans TaxID=2448030 RepID=A0A498DRB3_9BACI|nr:alanine racemase [Oceanobacillus piezotolerans]RLL46999.1 alanine racemase [Oceanobacillus piezotolerans]